MKFGARVGDLIVNPRDVRREDLRGTIRCPHGHRVAVLTADEIIIRRREPRKRTAQENIDVRCERTGCQYNLTEHRIDMARLRAATRRWRKGSLTVALLDVADESPPT